jgi:hypothetical protein
MQTVLVVSDAREYAITGVRQFVVVLSKVGVNS